MGRLLRFSLFILPADLQNNEKSFAGRTGLKGAVIGERNVDI